MSSPSDLGNLNTSAWERLQDRAERLEALWREQGPVDLNLLLPPPGDPARLASLVELIKTDLEIRWRRDKGVRLEWYVEHFEELGAVSELSARLIYEEYRTRQLHGDKPELSSYKRRFPRQYADVEQLARAEPVGTVSPALPTQRTPPPPIQPSATSATGDGISREYSRIEQIGTGSFGEVWRAVAPGGIFVALKIIYRPVGSDADQHEKKAIDRIKNLSHPFLLSTHTYWIAADGRLHIVMDLADGTLRDRLKACLKCNLPGIPPDELLGQMRQSAQALDYVHSEGLYHRDIKPDNILIKKGFAKVGDFSLVRKQDTLSMDGAAAGTLAYMGPECFKGNVGKQTDQYGLAVTYFELRTNRRPFPPRTNWYDAMVDAVEGTPDLTPLQGPELAVIVKALAKKPEDRYASCLAFVEALETALKGEPAQPRAAEPVSWIQAMRRIGPDGYQLLHRLVGSSGVGQFWEAVAPGGKHVALQIIENLDQGGVLKHLRAYDLARCLAGAANVLHIHENWLASTAGEVRSLADVLKGQTEERVALIVVQELTDDDLARRLGGSRRKLSDERLGQLLTYLKQAALTLDHLNARTHMYARRQVAIRHCAIRPENLLLVGDEVRITHFDLAQEVTEPSEPLRAHAIDLQPGYAAPELLERGGGNVTAASDQYSLAMTFVKLRTGSLPFDQPQSSNRIIDEQLEGKLNLKSLPERERSIIAKATARRPEDRYPSCAALIAALEAVHRASLAEVVIEPPSVQEETVAKKPPTQRPVLDRPTPAPGKWRMQGLGKGPTTDVTLRPGQKEEEESRFDIFVPPKEKAKPREEPKPQRVPSEPPPHPYGPGWKGASRVPRGLSLVFIGACFVLLLALIAWKLLLPHLGGFTVVEPEPVTVAAGKSATVRLQVQRSRFDRPIRLKAAACPSGVTFSECLIGPDEESAEVTVGADASANLGESNLTIITEADGRKAQETTLRLIISGFKLIKPDPVTVQAGKNHTAPMRVQRSHSDGPIWLKPINGPHGLSLSGSIEAGKDSAQVTIHADASAKPGSYNLTIRAEADGHQPRDIVLSLIIQAMQVHDGPAGNADANAKVKVEKVPDPKLVHPAVTPDLAQPTQELLESARNALADVPPKYFRAKELTDEILRQKGILVPGQHAITRLGENYYQVALIGSTARMGLGEFEEANAFFRSLLDFAGVKLRPSDAPGLVKKLLDPAIADWTKAKDSPPKGLLLAYLHAYKGRLIFEHRLASWNFDESPIKVAIQAFENAVKWYPAGGDSRQAAEYLMWQGYLMTHDVRVDIEHLGRLAIEANRIAPNYSGSRFLAGLADHHKAVVSMSDSAQVIDLEERAITAVTEAIRLAETDNPKPVSLPLYYTVRSAASVVLGDFQYRKSRELRAGYRSLLEGARKDVENVIALRPTYLWIAYQLLGNVLEDLAWRCAKDDDERKRLYEEAEAAFTQSCEACLELCPQPLIGRGRACYKQTVNGKADPSYLLNAERDLEKACGLARKDNDGSQLAEASLWLGLVRLAFDAPKLKEAAKAIHEGLTMVPVHDLRFVVSEVMAKELATARRIKARNETGAAYLLGEVRKQCEEVKTKGKIWEMPTAVVLVACLQFEGKSKDIKEICDQYLREPLDHSVDTVHLLGARSMVTPTIPDGNFDVYKRAFEDPNRARMIAADLERALNDAKCALEIATNGNMDVGVIAMARYYLGGASYRCATPNMGMEARRPYFERTISECEEALRLDDSHSLAWQWKLYAANAYCHLYGPDLLEAKHRKLREKVIKYFQSVIDEAEAGQDEAINVAKSRIDFLSKKAP